MDVSEIFQHNDNSIKVMKMSKGYNWEIKIHGKDMDLILKEIAGVDEKLKAQYPI